MVFFLPFLLVGCIEFAPSGGGGGDGGGGSATSSGSSSGGGSARVTPGATGGGSTEFEDPEAPKALKRSQCQDMTDGGPVPGPDCITGYIECGQTVVGHTLGGVDRFNSQWWQTNYCWPGTYNHNSGDERVYSFTMPKPPMRAQVTLDTPCADLDVMAFVWNGTGCPSQQNTSPRCECLRKNGTTSEMIELVSDQKDQWLIVVEGVDDHEGAFALTVECLEGLF